MKKTIITLLALAGVAVADTATTTIFTDLTQDKTITLSDNSSIIWSATTDTFTGSIYSTVSSQQARASMSFTLNLTDAATVGSTKTELVTITKTGYDNTIGLWLVDGKISGRWNDGTWDKVTGEGNPGTASGQVAISSILTNNENVFTLDGDKFIALTLVLDRTCDANNSDNVGMVLYDADGSVVWNCCSLGAAGFTTYDAIKLNTDYVGNAASITNAVLSPTDAGTQAAAIVPEPTTATLSLLALAGLAARRRRR